MNNEPIPLSDASILTPADVRPTDGVAPPPRGDADAAAIPPADPTPSPGAAAPPPAPSSAQGATDSAGVVFNPAVHEVGPDGGGILTYRKTWRLKGSRGRRFTKNPDPRKPDADQAEPHDQAEPAPSPGAAAPPPAPGPVDAYVGTPDRVAEATVEPDQPTQMIGREEYRTTASAYTRGMFAVAKIFFGKAWEPEPQELKEWNAAWQETLYEWQAPRLGSTAALIVLAFTSTAKRSDDPETKSAWLRFRLWVGRLFGRRAPGSPDPIVQPEGSGLVIHSAGTLHGVHKIAGDPRRDPANLGAF